MPISSNRRSPARAASPWKPRVSSPPSAWAPCHSRCAPTPRPPPPADVARAALTAGNGWASSGSGTTGGTAATTACAPLAVTDAFRPQPPTLP